MQYLTKEELIDQLDYIHSAPKNQGEVNMLVIRPKSNHREVLPEVEASPEEGFHGDRWALGKNEDPEHLAQITLMNYRVLSLIAFNDEERMALAGDNIVVDLDLSEENLRPGDKITIGEVELEITPQPHNGCKKFAERFGAEALGYINAMARRHLHYRGIYAKITKAGKIRKGDKLVKMLVERDRAY